MTDPIEQPAPQPTEHVLRWIDPNADHPVIAELAAHPGWFGVIQDDVIPASPFGGVGNPNDAVAACLAHPRIAMKQVGRTVRASWMTDEQHDLYIAEEMAKETERMKAADGQAGGSDG